MIIILFLLHLLHSHFISFIHAQANAEAAAEVPGGEGTETAPGNGN